MAYLIDTSCLIEAKNHRFCFDICPGFWDWLERSNAVGNLFSIDRVFQEIDEGNDELKIWAKQRGNGFFLPSDVKALAEVSRINTWVMTAGYKTQVVAELFQGDDPFLIAFALAHGHTVVTNETLVVGEKKRVKIPVICQEFKIPWLNPLEMLRTEKVRFILPS